MCSGRPKDLQLELSDFGNEDLIKKNRKRKPLGAIQVRLKLSPVTKAEMNEVSYNSYGLFCFLYSM